MYELFAALVATAAAAPAINFELQLRLYDLGHTIVTGSGFAGHTAVGLTIGIPFSKIAY